MLSTSQRWVKTSRGRVVYDRKLHPFSDRDVERITKRWVDDNSGFMEEIVLPFMVRVSRWMLEQILALAGAEALAGPILDWLIEMGNRILQAIGFFGEVGLNKSAYKIFQWLCQPNMSNAQLAALGKQLTSQYSTKTV